MIVVVALLLFQAVPALGCGAILAAPGETTVLGDPVDDGGLQAIGALFLVVGLFNIVVAIGIFRGSNAARLALFAGTAIAVLYGLTASVDFEEIMASVGWIALLVYALIYAPGSREFFSS